MSWKNKSALVFLAVPLFGCNFNSYKDGIFSVAAYTTNPNRVYALECVKKGEFFRVMTATSGTTNLNLLHPEHPVYGMVFDNINTNSTFLNNCIDDGYSIAWEPVSDHFTSGNLPSVVQGNPDGWAVKVKTHSSGFSYQILDTTDNTRMELLTNDERQCIEADTSDDWWARWAACEQEVTRTNNQVITNEQSVLNEYRYMGNVQYPYTIAGTNYFDTHSSFSCPGGVEFESNFGFAFYGAGCSVPR